MDQKLSPPLALAGQVEGRAAQQLLSGWHTRGDAAGGGAGGVAQGLNSKLAESWESNDGGDAELTVFWGSGSPPGTRRCASVVSCFSPPLIPHRHRHHLPTAPLCSSRTTPDEDGIGQSV